MQLSVVVPVRNEADNVEPLVNEIRAALTGQLEYEIIYVDDGSDDGMLERLKALAAACPELRVLRHARNCGQSTGVRTGVRAARAPWIATLDGDGQNDPADIMALYRAVQDPDRPRLKLANGWRYQRKDTWFRRLSSRVANAVRSALLGDDTPDSGCGLKVFSREAYLDLPFFDHLHRFTPAMFLASGAEVVSVKVGHRDRTRGTSKYGLHNRLWAGLVDLLGVMWLRRRATRPEVSDETPARGNQVS